VRTPFAAANVGMFYQARHPAIVPDMFLSLGVQVADDWWHRWGEQCPPRFRLLHRDLMYLINGEGPIHIHGGCVQRVSRSTLHEFIAKYAIEC
jgi:hypothetical protein